MATAESVHQDLLDKIEELAKKTTRPDGALMLAEAYALMYQNQPHGGSPSTG
jgi:hypothetical protein